ncbi:MAG: cell division protein FtsQ/DivIB [Senegalia sp. (in: firmicutes)]|uniref:cell division protein FtsQ/DivIB n=1 Tax=Senegalia sp. (in: firmicutes) TaxID=1924098 RepID=UPI003F995F7A
MKKQYKVDKKLKRKRMVVMIMLSIFFIALLFMILLTQTTLFTIKNINIENNNVIKKEKIILASGITRGENIFKINKKTIEKNLLNHPYIKTATIKTKFPDSINIDITERKETLVYDNNGNYIYIDNEGVILNNLSTKKDKNIPILESDDKLDPKEDEYISNILKLLNEHNKKKYEFNIKKIIKQNKSTTLVLSSGIKVALDGVNDIEYKLGFIEKIVNDLEEKNIRAKEIQFNRGKNPIVVK